MMSPARRPSPRAEPSARTGFVAPVSAKDYGYDLILFTFDTQGYVEPGLVFLQRKASEALEQSGPDYVFDLDIRDYNLWMMDRMPVVLVLFEASRRRAYWLYIQDYFHSDPSRRSKARAKTVRLRVPARQTVNRQAMTRMRRLKTGRTGTSNGFSRPALGRGRPTSDPEEVSRLGRSLALPDISWC